ncbi:hypothetical protein [Methylobacterium sp. Leaf108]|uniref:hypothetical protein n=1 Tax=Methylobacterium sp. Leaf108 TaxID=1736256 RepID=UPI000700F218|nr:hypothetical protein [Methylobacterium sp. Leaf108]KQP55052.1 hypothetical protein ASF39_04775 [Methylobacterium sp. Leaf108]
MQMMSPAILADAQRHARAEYPCEACGLVVGGAYQPCRNEAADPLQDFAISTRIAGINRSFDRLALEFGIAMPEPTLLEELDAWLVDFEAGAFDHPPPAPRTAPAKSGIPAIIAKLDAMGATKASTRSTRKVDADPAPAATPEPANDDTRAGDRRVGLLGTRKHRRSDVRSQLTRERTKDFFFDDLAERKGSAFSREITPLPFSSNHTPITNDNTPITNDNTPITKPIANDNRLPEDWRRTTIIGKFGTYQRALYEFGTPWAWTLDISPDEVAAGIASKNFATRLLKRIAKHLRLKLGRDPVMTLAIDVTTPNNNTRPRPHAHGGIACSAEELPAVRRALQRAGGAWAGSGSKYQVKVRRMSDPDGWSSYCTRNLAAARKVVGDNVIAASGDLKVAGRTLHERLRDRVIAAAA